MFDTEPLYIDSEAVDNIVTHWRGGGLVALPTETVYGLGADASNGRAVAEIFAVKSRPQFNPLIAHVADAETARRYGVWNDWAETLAAAFWPGPLTLVLHRTTDCGLSDLVSAGGSTVAIRVPAHPVAHQLLRAFGGAIAAPSANRSGRISPTTAAHVREELGDQVTHIVDGGPCEVGLESTVVDVSGVVPQLLRPGSITQEMLEAALGVAVMRHQEGKGGLVSPGQLASHYAPNIPVRLNAAACIGREAMLAFGPTIGLEAGAHMLNLSPTCDVLEAAANLFAYMRALDQPEYCGIAVMPIPDVGVGVAINDRLRRAAHRD